MRTYANRPIHTHPTGYHEGQHGPFKPSRVTQFGRARRELTDRLTGEWHGGRFTATLADTDHSLKTRLLADPAQGRGLLSRAYIVSLDGGRLGVDPRQWYAGPLLSWDVDLTGSLALEFGDQIANILGGVIGPDRVLPKRRITATDFPNAPQASLDLPVPIIYSGHITDGNNGLPVIYVGPRAMADGNTWHEWVVAGHALWGFDRLNVDHVNVSGWGSDWAMPGQSGWSTVTGSSAPYRDYNGRRYACVYGKGAQADSVANGEAQLLLECYGVERSGTGGGALVRALGEQIVHWLVNWVLGDYQSGPWLAMPSYAAAWPQINAASFLALDTLSTTRLAAFTESPPVPQTEYNINLYLGVRQGDSPTATVEDDSVSVRDLLGWIARSADIRIGLNEYHQWTASMLPDTIAAADVPVYGTTIPARILKDSWKLANAFDGQWTRLTTLSNRAHVTGGVTTGSPGTGGNASPDWGGTEIYVNTALETALGTSIAGPTLELPFVPNYDARTLTAQGEDIAQRVLARHAVPVRTITWETTRCGGSKSDLGDLVYVDHYAWPTPRLVQVEMMETGLGSVTMSGWDLTHVVAVTQGSEGSP